MTPADLDLNVWVKKHGKGSNLNFWGDFFFEDFIVTFSVLAQLFLEMFYIKSIFTWNLFWIGSLVVTEYDSNSLELTVVRKNQTCPCKELDTCLASSLPLNFLRVTRRMKWFYNKTKMCLVPNLPSVVKLQGASFNSISGLD